MLLIEGPTVAGGLVLVVDNEKSEVPVLNRSYQELVEHYKTTHRCDKKFFSL